MPRLCPPLPFYRSTEPNEFLLGRLVLPTGRLVACDPLVGLAEARPFCRTVTPGIYAVRLGALLGDAAYVAVLFSEGEVVHWEAALREGQRPPPSLEEAPGFDVDATTGAYLDAAGIRALRNGPDVYARICDAGYRERPHAVIDLGGAGNLVAFGTGGDGRFASYWGLDREGAPVVLVTDLGVLRVSRTELRADGEVPHSGAKIIPFPKRR